MSAVRRGPGTRTFTDILLHWTRVRRGLSTPEALSLLEKGDSVKVVIFISLPRRRRHMLVLGEGELLGLLGADAACTLVHDLAGWPAMVRICLEGENALDVYRDDAPLVLWELERLGILPCPPAPSGEDVPPADTPGAQQA